MTPKERVDQLQRIYEKGGDEALEEFANTNPVEYLQAIEATYIVEGDDEGLKEFQADVSGACRKAVEEHLTRNGFAVWDELARIARERGMNDAADNIASYLKRLRH